MSKIESKPTSSFVSLLVSIGGWFFVAIVTSVLFLAGLFFLWPPSILLEQNSGRLPHGVSQCWARFLTNLLPFWEIRTEGLEQIDQRKAYVIVSNHQSMVDILVLLARLPLHFKFIAKRELFWIPFLGWHLALARYIPLKRGDPESGRACLIKAWGWLRQGVSVLFFPEGTRSPDGRIQAFKAGAFKLALEEKVDLLPLVILGTRAAVPKHSWLVQQRTSILLKVLEPILIRGFEIKDLESLRERVRSSIVAEFEKYSKLMAL
jgi:1-acyl-sn-glycerol-3-phosphate acyltransferase